MARFASHCMELHNQAGKHCSPMHPLYTAALQSSIPAWRTLIKNSYLQTSESDDVLEKSVICPLSKMKMSMLITQHRK